MACFAFVWICHRAAVQSITIDEADTIAYWVNAKPELQWQPHSNNHVLNSAMMELVFWLFGEREWTARLPALLGGGLFMCAIGRLCALLSVELALRSALFACFVYNPFIMDYLVAARGYGLALGFMSVVLFVVARGILQGWTERDLAIVSACAGMSVCSNFSFAYANGCLLLGAAFSAARRGNRWVRLAGTCVLPAAAVLLVFAGSALTRFPRSELVWGTDRLNAMWNDIAEACFTELNPRLVNPLLMDWFSAFQLYWPLLLGGFACLSAIAFVSRSRCAVFPAYLAAALAMTILMHWLQFHLLKVPLPFERTSIFLVPIVTALVGSLAAVAPVTRLWRAVHWCGLALLVATGLCFVGELRDTYFRQWKFGAEVKAVFPLLLDLCRRNGYREITVDWEFPNSANFYRRQYGATYIEEIRYYDPLPTGKPIYMVSEAAATAFLKDTPLKRIWHGTVSDLVVLVQPGDMEQ